MLAIFTANPQKSVVEATTFEKIVERLLDEGRQGLSLIDPEVTLARVVIDPVGWDVPEASHARVSTLFGQAYRKLKSCVYPPFTSE